MKTLLSIPLTLLILFSGINIRYAAHFCGGNLVATKVTFSGELATCGMESKSESKSSDLAFNNHCCDNITTAYSICNNYIPSSLYLKESGQQVTSVTFIPVVNPSDQKILSNYLKTSKRPPGVDHPDSFDCQVLCIFRI
jgi:hypothetical protein